MRNAAAPCRLVMCPATAAATSPGRGISFRLIVKVSVRGRHFHGAVTPRHFYVAVATPLRKIDNRPAAALHSGPQAGGITGVLWSAQHSVSPVCFVWGSCDEGPCNVSPRDGASRDGRVAP